MATAANGCKTGLMEPGTGDRLAIHELLSVHGHPMDDVVHGLRALGAGTLHGIAAIRNAALRLGGQNPVAHHLTNVVVTESAGFVAARSKGLGLRADGSMGSMAYHDELRHTPEGRRISRRSISPRLEPLVP